MKYLFAVIVLAGIAGLLPIYHFTKYSYSDNGSCDAGVCYYIRSDVYAKGNLLDFINAKQQKKPTGIIVDSSGQPIQ